MQSFGDWMRSRRRDLNLTQEEASQRAKIGRSMWARLETGTNLPGRRSVPGIAVALEVDAKEVYEQFLPGLEDSDMKRTPEEQERLDRFAKNLRMAMGAKDVGPTELSRMLPDVTPQAVSRWMKAQNWPGADKMDLIATALDVSVDDFYRIEAATTMIHEDKVKKMLREILLEPRPGNGDNAPSQENPSSFRSVRRQNNQVGTQGRELACVA